MCPEPPGDVNRLSKVSTIFHLSNFVVGSCVGTALVMFTKVPPIIPSFFIGGALTSLVYRFADGLEKDAQFKIPGVVKIGGSLASFAASISFFNHYLTLQNDVSITLFKVLPDAEGNDRLKPTSSNDIFIIDQDTGFPISLQIQSGEQELNIVSPPDNHFDNRILEYTIDDDEGLHLDIGEHDEAVDYLYHLGDLSFHQLRSQNIFSNGDIALYRNLLELHMENHRENAVLNRIRKDCVENAAGICSHSQIDVVVTNYSGLESGQANVCSSSPFFKQFFVLRSRFLNFDGVGDQEVIQVEVLFKDLTEGECNDSEHGFPIIQLSPEDFLRLFPTRYENEDEAFGRREVIKNADSSPVPLAPRP